MILDYDGRIKYKNGKYVNIIHKNDTRYNIIQEVIDKKKEILKNITLDVAGSGFYFEFGFNIDNRIGLCYDYNFSYTDKFEICYYDWRVDIKQIRTYL
jgi:hypothetical protein